MLGKEKSDAVGELGEGTIESEGTWWRTLGPGRLVGLAGLRKGQHLKTHAFVGVEFAKEDGFDHGDE